LFGLWHTEVITELHEMNEACQIVGQGRREDAVGHSEAVSDNGVSWEFSSGLIPLGDAIWCEPFSKAVSSKDEKAKVIGSNMIMNLFR